MGCCNDLALLGSGPPSLQSDRRRSSLQGPVLVLVFKGFIKGHPVLSLPMDRIGSL